MVPVNLSLPISLLNLIVKNTLLLNFLKKKKKKWKDMFYKDNNTGKFTSSVGIVPVKLVLSRDLFDLIW